MRADHNNKILATGFAAISAIFFFTFALLLVVSAGVFVALGITFANETGDSKQAEIGIVGGVFAIVFYVVLGLIFVLPTAVASWKLFKHRERARSWGIIAAILVAPIVPLGTIFAIYGLWFFFSTEGQLFYLNFKSEAI